ncbi:hypothetical protein [Cellulosimicrobium cellulans]|uniref:hypothetical protein n=1 Tax=Cellulosimicrobium cellulans TaxID=1710 RepID=UPI000848C23B|nr:hypothetical protein [Cellulosimicrobium cellulans]
MNDDRLAAALRDRVRRAPIHSDLEPGAVLGRARRTQARRRTLGAAGSLTAVAAVAVLAVPALSDVTGTDRSRDVAATMAGRPASTPEPGTTTTAPGPARDVNGVRACSGFSNSSTGNSATGFDENGRPVEVSGLEGWWNGTPANADGGMLPVEEWPQQILDHPATVTLETVDGTVLESFDRRTCTGVTDYVPPPLDQLPPDAIVVLDAQTGEVLAEHPLNTPDS